MQAYLIDPQNQTVTQVEYTGDYRNIYEHIGADCFDAATFNEQRDCAFVDDNGLLKNPKRFFIINGYASPLAGKGLVLGCDEAGKSVSPTVTLDWLKDNVAFIEMLAPGMLSLVAPRGVSEFAYKVIEANA